MSVALVPSPVIHPTREEAQKMFAGNKGLAMVTVVIDGELRQLHRDGQIDPEPFIRNPFQDGHSSHVSDPA